MSMEASVNNGVNVNGSNERLSSAIAYAFGFFTGIIVLLIAGENRVIKFHAWQSVIGSVLIGAIGILVIFMLPVPESFRPQLDGVLWLLLLVYLWFGAIMVYTGKSFRIPVVAELTEKYFVK